jgi:Tol biopolymer transport system component
MMLNAGTKLGPYEIIAALGAGGMGEVYRARDTRLGRDVAIKVLPEHLSADPEIRARFEREAKTVSSLNHPHICVLFDVGRVPGEAGSRDTDFLVMELVEGDTLAERLRRGPLSAAELLRFGTQIADALDRAHRAGVIHRDLKPGNIMITRSGAKLMDFGLARVTGLAAPGSGSGATVAALTRSPTVAQPLTTEGTILGTFQYMPPEQLEGREADARGDIWALGCVLYEMATGRRAFEGRSQASLIAAILERQPPALSEAPSGSAVATGGMPQGLDRLIRNCLAKDPEDRVQTAHDVKLQLQGIAEGAGLSGTSVASAQSPALAAAAARARRGGTTLAWALAALALIAGGTAVAWLYPLATAPRPSYRFRLSAIAGTTDQFWPRVSPDGRCVLVEAGDSAGTQRAYVRPMDEITAVPIAGSEGLSRAYWSPDSREIAFVANDKIMRVPIGGGSPVIVAEASSGSDLSWSSKGYILRDARFTDSLSYVPAGGGELKPATRIDRTRHEVGTGWPCFLPDGEHFLFIGNLEGAGVSTGDIRLGKIGSLDSKWFGQSDGRVEYAPGDWVLFVRGTSLLAQKLDVGAGKLTGQPITITDRLRMGSSAGHFSISRTGVLAMSIQSGEDAGTVQVAGRSGITNATPLVTGLLANPRPSPEGHRLLYLRSGRSLGNSGEVYVFDLDRATNTRLTFTGDLARAPQWSPDGRRFAYVVKSPNGVGTVHIASADGLGGQDSIVAPPGPAPALFQWTEAGSRLVLHSGQGVPITVPTEGTNRTFTPLTDSTSVMIQPQVSPDGRWLTGVIGSFPNLQIFVQSLSGTPGRWQISSGIGGIEPQWTKGGKELVYEGWDGRMMAVDIDTKTGFHAGTPHVLFALPTRSFAVDMPSWGCDAAGEKFYLFVSPRQLNGGDIEVVSGFRQLVTRK